MPCYEYFCSQCKKRFEAICNKDNRDDIVCFTCGTKGKRMITSCSHVIIGYCYNNEYNKKERPNE